MKEVPAMEADWVAGNEEPGRAGWRSTAMSSVSFLRMVNLLLVATIILSN